MICKHCHKVMLMGEAIDPKSPEGGLPSFPHRLNAKTLEIIEVWKCNFCGHSEYLDYTPGPPSGRTRRKDTIMRDSDTNEFCNPDSTWIIVYPRGDRRQLAVVEICSGLEYEKSDYAIASRREFLGDPDGAYEYARELAAANGLSVDGENAYLD